MMKTQFTVPLSALALSAGVLLVLAVPLFGAEAGAEVDGIPRTAVHFSRIGA